MASLDAFHKLKELHDRDRKQHQKNHQEAVEVFEDQAEKLYKALKEKEQAEKTFEQQLHQNHVLASAFLQHQSYIERLEERIEGLQPVVSKARTKMNQTQALLSDSYIEVKKFESIIERKQESKKQRIKAEEYKQMDEQSMQQFLNYRDR
ncbi:flagellar export protein FliJ [Halobacillus fulvus]|nr:flagellar export protein FliJ [Halobacillus fulvus]